MSAQLAASPRVKQRTMLRDRPTHPTRHVHAALRDDFIHGRRFPDAPLTISDLSARFRFSPTPVREALARLVGEGLVVVAPGGGYACAPLDALMLLRLRRLEALLLETGARLAGENLHDLPSRLALRIGASATLTGETHWLMLEIARASGDEVLLAVLSSLSARLGVVRRAEAGGGHGELAGLAEALSQAGDLAVAGLAHYFDARRGREAETCDLIEHLRANEHPH